METGLSIQSGDTLVFIGDSITDAERHRRVYSPLGFGYVHFTAYTLRATYPELDIHVVNTGVSGDTILDLSNRWSRDALAHEPSVLSVLVGINDVWRLAMEPSSGLNAAPPREYELTYDQLLSQTKDRCGSQLVLVEPFMFCRDQRNTVFRALQPYLEAVRRLAAKHGATLVCLQQNINELIKRVPPEKWSDDTVHPHTWAHAWIALRWLEATGLVPDRGRKKN
jgi:lysophospholipase L1-like esterase